MEKVTITIDTDNSAFEDAPASEVARILRDLAGKLEASGGIEQVPRRVPLFDLNGNVCGYFTR